MSLLRTRLAPGVLRGGVPDLLLLTAMARDVALADITEIGGMTGSGRGAVALFTGIVVHGPEGDDLVAPEVSELRWPKRRPGRRTRFTGEVPDEGNCVSLRCPRGRMTASPQRHR